MNSTQNNEKNREDLFDEIRQLLLESTSHGLPRIIKSITKREWTLAVLWSVLFIGSFSYCVFTIINCFISYYSYGVTVKMTKVQNFRYFSSHNNLQYKSFQRNACNEIFKKRYSKMFFK